MNRNFVIRFVTSPCNSSLGSSCAKSAMASSCGEDKVTALLTEGVSSSGEWELAIDETPSTVSLAQNVCVVHGFFVAVQDIEEYVEEFVHHLSGEQSAAPHFDLEGEADDNDGSVDIMSGITAVGDAGSAGWTFADALAGENLSVETLVKGVVHTSHVLTC